MRSTRECILHVRTTRNNSMRVLHLHVRCERDVVSGWYRKYTQRTLYIDCYVHTCINIHVEAT